MPTQKLATGFVALISVLAVVSTLFAIPSDDGLIDLANGATCLAIAAVILARIYSGTDRAMPRSAWLLAFAALDLLAIIELYEGKTEQLEQALQIETFGDLFVWSIVPVGLFLAIRAERVGPAVTRYLLAGFAAQILTIGLDVITNLWPSGDIGHCLEAADVPIEFIELMSLSCYLLGLTSLVGSRAKADRLDPAKASKR